MTPQEMADRLDAIRHGLADVADRQTVIMPKPAMFDDLAEIAGYLRNQNAQQGANSCAGDAIASEPKSPAVGKSAVLWGVLVEAVADNGKGCDPCAFRNRFLCFDNGCDKEQERSFGATCDASPMHHYVAVQEGA